MISSFGLLLNQGCAGYYFLSTPKGGHKADNRLFLVSNGLNIGCSVITAALLKAPIFSLLNEMIFAIYGFSIYSAMGVCRDYMAMHTDAQIDAHLARSFSTVGAAIGPLIFLVAETTGCVLTHTPGEDMEQCDRLYLCNYSVSIQLVSASLFFLGTDFTQADVTVEDIIALRNVDAGHVIRFCMQCLNWLIALFIFGSRPRDVGGATDEYAEGRLISTVDIFNAILAVQWFAMIWQENFHMRHKIRMEAILTGDNEDDEGEQSWFRKSWLKMWESANAWLKRNSVPAGVAKVSLVFRICIATFSWLFLSPYFLSVLFLIFNGPHDDSMFLMEQWGVAFKMCACGSAIAYYFLDLEFHPGTQYVDLHPFVLCIGLGLDVVLVKIVSGKIGSINAMTFASVCTVTWIAKTRRKRAIVDFSQKKKHHHVYIVVIGGMTQVATPLFFMTSEMAECWLRDYYTAGNGDTPMRDMDQGCEGIQMGLLPIMALMTVISSSAVIFIDRKNTLTIENIARLNMGLVEGAEVAIFGLCALYALIVYSLRGERPFDYDGFEGTAFLVFIIAVTSGLVLVGCSGKKEEFVEEEKLRSATLYSAGPLSPSVEARKNIANKKSIWEGGARGALGRGSIVSISKRGLEIESNRDSPNAKSERGHGSSAIESSANDTVFNPGFI
jgi:hypothetical protein